MFFLVLFLQASPTPVEQWCAVAEPKAYEACLAQNRPAPDTSAAWPDYLRPHDWRFVSRSDDAALFTNPGPASPAAHPRVWFRYEWRDTQQGGYRSAVQLVEADCAKGQNRRLQGATYSKNNMQGVGSTLTTEAWSFPIPGTMDAAAYDEACGKYDVDQFFDGPKAKKH
jgi:hypothetical protein